MVRNLGIFNRWECRSRFTTALGSCRKIAEIRAANELYLQMALGSVNERESQRTEASKAKIHLIKVAY